MIGPTWRLVTALLLGLPPWILALWVPGLETMGVIYLLGLAGVAALDLVFTPRRRSFEAELALPKVLSLAHEEPVTVRLLNRSGLSGRARVRLVVPEAWRLDRPVEEIRLRGHGRAEAVFRVLPRKRGKFEAGPVYLRFPTPVGLFLRDLRLDARAETKVYPAIAPIRQFALLSRRQRTRDMGLRAHRLRGQGMEFARLRDYHPDDDIRLVDWKATARRGRLISREYQVERCQNIVMLIDAGRMLTEEVDGIVKIEYVLNAALLLTRIAAEYDDRVGAVVVSDRVERSTPLRKGRAAVGAMAEAVYDVEPRLCEANYEEAFAHLNVRYRKRALVVLFTNVVDQETSSLVSGCLKGTAWRHVPLLVAVGDRETREAAWAAPRAPGDLYRKGAAAQMLVSRAKTLQDLQRQGVHVIDAPAGEISVALINKYLDLKTRQVI